jgi:hypothetical protein
MFCRLVLSIMMIFISSLYPIGSSARMSLDESRHLIDEAVLNGNLELYDVLRTVTGINKDELCLRMTLFFRDAIKGRKGDDNKNRMRRFVDDYNSRGDKTLTEDDFIEKLRLRTLEPSLAALTLVYLATRVSKVPLAFLEYHGRRDSKGVVTVRDKVVHVFNFETGCQLKYIAMNGLVDDGQRFANADSFSLIDHSLFIQPAFKVSSTVDGDAGVGVVSVAREIYRIHRFRIRRQLSYPEFLQLMIEQLPSDDDQIITFIREVHPDGFLNKEKRISIDDVFEYNDDIQSRVVNLLLNDEWDKIFDPDLSLHLASRAMRKTIVLVNEPLLTVGSGFSTSLPHVDPSKTIFEYVAPSKSSKLIKYSDYVAISNKVLYDTHKKFVNAHYDFVEPGSKAGKIVKDAISQLNELRLKINPEAAAMSRISSEHSIFPENSALADILFSTKTPEIIVFSTEHATRL